MSYSKLILRDSAEIVWPLDDITESSSVSRPINFLYNNSYALSASINAANSNIIHTPIVFGGGKSLSLTSSAVGLSIPALGRFSELYSNKNSCISFWLQIDGLTTQERTIFKKRNFNNVGLFLKDNYLTFKYGTSASYIEVSGDISNPEEPNHILIGKTPSSLLMMINGIPYVSKNFNSVSLDKDDNHIDNDYLDFYGTNTNSWIVDSISFYSNILSENDAKRHYVYGLGKNIGDDIFHHRGGTIYNFSNISTEKLLNINWRYPQQWINATLSDLNNDIFGISSIQFNEPDFYYYSSEILTASNNISFRNNSGSISSAAYIDITSLFNKIGSGDYPFFIKVKLDGPLPKTSEKQRIISIGDKPDQEILQFNLYNDSASYKLLIESYNSSSVAFNIYDINSAPYIYIGMKFSDHSTFYFTQTGSAIQSAEFNYSNLNNYGLDPLVQYFPLSDSKIIRIGSAISYDKTNYSTSLPSVSQFGGSFEKFMVHQKDFTASVSYAYLDNYKKARYQVSFDSSLNRFKTYSYGNGTFNIHAIDMAEFITDDNQRIGANIINIGYPDIVSSSQVMFYVTHLDYNENILYPKTKINQINYLNFINNIDLSGTYLKFDFEIYSQDSNYYPPRIKNFTMETYKTNDNNILMRHDDGEKYTLYQTSSIVYLPEIKRTPNIFLTKYSGIKLSKTFADFKDDFASQPLDPRTIDGLVLWLDSRFINGLNSINPVDDSKIRRWKDLSGNNFDATAFVLWDIGGNPDYYALAPTFRVQSLNILTNNQGNGAENGTLENILPVNCSAFSSPDGAVQGLRGIKVTPSGTSVDSYINLGKNTASFTLAPNQSYSVVGSIKMLRPQTASYLHPDSRKIVIYTTNGVTETFTASTSAASNAASTTNLYAEFTTGSNVLGASIRCYNGSFSANDVVYWDNIAVYPKQSGSYVNEWKLPLTSFNDSPVVKFNKMASIYSVASAGPISSLYTVSRQFTDGSNNTLSIDFVSGSYSYSYVSIESASWWGDYAAVLLFNSELTNSNKILIEDWLRESFNID